MASTNKTTWNTGSFEQARPHTHKKPDQDEAKGGIAFLSFRERQLPWRIVRDRHHGYNLSNDNTKQTITLGVFDYDKAMAALRKANAGQQV